LLADGLVQLLGLSCSSSTCAILGRALRDLPGVLPYVTVIAIVRDGVAFVPVETDHLQLGDSVYIITRPDKADEVLRFFGHVEKIAQRVAIVGAGNVGLNLARQLIRSAPSLSLKIIESSKARAEYVSRELGTGAVVLHGDALDKDILTEANVASCQTVVAVTNDDETNIFASVLAKREGAGRAITLVNKSVYEAILPGLGIDVVVSPNSITISSILRHVRPRSIAALYSLRENFGEVIEAVAQPGSGLVGKPLIEVDVPRGLLIGVVVRSGKVIFPDGQTGIEAGDRVIAMVTYEALDKVSDLLGGSAAQSWREQGTRP
jgi:trk system potassium uptake protein